MNNNHFTFLLLLAITCCSRPVSARIYQTVDAIIVEGIVTSVFVMILVSKFVIRYRLLFHYFTLQLWVPLILNCKPETQCFWSIIYSLIILHIGLRDNKIFRKMVDFDHLIPLNSMLYTRKANLYSPLWTALWSGQLGCVTAIKVYEEPFSWFRTSIWVFLISFLFVITQCCKLWRKWWAGCETGVKREKNRQLQVFQRIVFLNLSMKFASQLRTY